ncbi:MAG: Asp-tRNA(Asn)/Glu-tRNA(Gln) amidotransferase subunit GatC [Planctomycetota bacterium]
MDAAPKSDAPKVGRDDVAKIARLARLRLEEDELDRIWPQLAKIVGYVEQLAEVDTDGVEPMAHAVERTNVLRDDVPVEMLPRDKALANAPKNDGKYFLVPQIIDAE